MELLPRLLYISETINRVCKGYCVCGVWSVGTALGGILGFTKGAGLALMTGGEKKRNTGCCAK